MVKTPLQYEVYDIAKTYEQNYALGPFFDGEIPERKVPEKKIKIFDFELNSRLGVPAGPLLNANWVSFYAQMGFDIPVYKTVRSIERAVHPAPNCVYINPDHQFAFKELPRLIESNAPQNLEDLAITNSFGVPSMPPKIWMADVEKGNRLMGEGQVMIVSISGTDGAEGRNLIEDSVYTAKLAQEAGAKIIEINYSCPNVNSGEGMLYGNAEGSSKISQAIRKAIGPHLPFLIKMGNLPYERLKEVIQANRPFVDGISGINTIPGEIRKTNGDPALPGEGRLRSGICGNPIRNVAQAFVTNCHKLRSEWKDDFVICGVGGLMMPEHFEERIAAGADIVMSATAAMWDPFLAHRYLEPYGNL